MTIAGNVIEKCGGVARVAEICGCTENWVYRWRLDRLNGGTGGLVPRSAQEALLQAAKDGKVNITPADFFDAVQP
jgi:hypothetical protein